MSGRRVSLRRFLRARDEKDFREWPSHIGRDARSQARDPLRSPSWRALPLPRSLKASRKTSPCTGFGLFPDMERVGSAELALVKRMAEVVSGILPREDKATAMRVLSLSGKPSASRSGSAVSTLIRKVSGLRRYRPGRFLGEAAMTNAGPLAGMRRCIFPHVFAAVMARSCRLLSALRPMAPSMPTHKDHEKDVRAEACPRSWVEKKADAATGACSSADAPKGVRKVSPQPRASRAP